MVGDIFESMFSEFVSVDGIGVECVDLVNSLVEGYIMFESIDDIADGIYVLFRHPIAVEDESRFTVEDGFT